MEFYSDCIRESISKYCTEKASSIADELIYFCLENGFKLPFLAYCCDSEEYDVAHPEQYYINLRWSDLGLTISIEDDGTISFMSQKDCQLMVSTENDTEKNVAFDLVVAALRDASN